MSAAAPLVKDVHTYYGKSHILHGVSLEVLPGRGGGPPGPQRCGQEHDAQDHHRARASRRRPGGPPGPAGGTDAAAPARPSRDRVGTRGPARIPPPHRPGEPPHGPRPPGSHRSAEERAPGQGLCVLPRARRAALPGGRYAVGRRAADARHRAGHDAGAEDHSPRRADRGADAAHGVPDQPHRRGLRRTAWPSCSWSRTCRSRSRRPARLHHGEGRGAAPRPVAELRHDDAVIRQYLGV